jgi:Protein of unknown function DUF262
MQKPLISNFTTLDFVNWQESGSLSLTPKFQRREVWKTPARSYFIDSVLCEFPIPPIFIRMAQSDDRKHVVREIIDGQQRLRALLEFVADHYALSQVTRNYGGRRFSQLPTNAQDAIRSSSFICEVFTNLPDADVLEVFARVNTYSVALNAQELRNGRYFGHFKQAVYSLALEHLEFWRRFGIFTESSIARMSEVELTSELLIAQIAGQQDKKKSIDRFYANNEESFPEQAAVQQRFRNVMDAISEHVGSILPETEFRRPPLFYTLFCVVYHRCYELPNETHATPKRGRLSKEEGDRLRDSLLSLSDKITAAKQGQTISAADAAFISACLRQTDNIRPRNTRFSSVYGLAFD